MTHQPARDPDPRAGDVLYGARAIGAFLGIPVTKIYHRVRKRDIPFFKIGDILCARRSTLTDWLDEQEAASE